MRHDSKRCGPLTSLARWCGVLLAAALVAGCAGPRIDAHTYRSNSHDSRAQFLILHYTAVDLATSIRILTQQRVSSHYLVTDEQPPASTAWLMKTAGLGTPASAPGMATPCSTATPSALKS